MRLLSSLIICLGVLVLADELRADQCAWNKKDVAAKAYKIFKTHKIALDYCEPCGDKKPKEFSVGRIEWGPAKMGNEIQEGYFEVLHQGKGIDLAYVFVKKSGTKRQWQNLGDLAKCRDNPNGIDEVEFPSDVSPRDKKANKAAAFYGTYQSKDQLVKITLKKQTLHGPDWIKLVYNVISSEWGDSRSGMVGYLQLNHKQPTFFTAYDKCEFFFTRTDNGLKVEAGSSCGRSVTNKLTGDFKKIK